MNEPDPKAIVRHGYDVASHAYRGDDFAFERSGYAHWLGRLTRRLAEGARVLDLGCGNGIPVARELVKRFEVTGLDLSPVQVRRASELVPEARYVCGDMSEAQFPPDTFDAVVAFYSIINVPLAEQPALFARIATWLTPGGWLLAVVGRDPWTGIERDWRDVPGLPMYYSHTDARTYERWLVDAGFAIVERGTEPRDGKPGYSVLLARKAG